MEKYKINDATQLDKWITLISNTPGLNAKKEILKNTEKTDFLVSYLQMVYDEVNIVKANYRLYQK